jgi:hypothetical protein
MFASEIAETKRDFVPIRFATLVRVYQAFSLRSVARASVAKFRKSAENRAFAATLSQNTAAHSMASRH